MERNDVAHIARREQEGGWDWAQARASSTLPELPASPRGLEPWQERLSTVLPQKVPSPERCQPGFF